MSKLRRARRFVKIAKEVARLLTSMRDKPRGRDWVGVGLSVWGLAMNIADELQAYNSVDPARFDMTDWAYVHQAHSCLYLAKSTDHKAIHPYHTYSSLDATCIKRMMMAKIGNEDIAFMHHGSEGDDIDVQNVGRIMVRESREAESKRALASAMWEEINSDCALIIDRAFEADEAMSSYSFQPTALAEQLTKQLEESCLQADCRALIMYGPPGTGKSCIAKNIARNLGHRILRVHAKEFGSKHERSDFASSISQLVDLLQPDVFVIDDIDHVQEGAELLDMLEAVRDNCDFVIATANGPARLVSACLRPGRFDIMQEVNVVDPAFLHLLLGEWDEKLFDAVQLWPIAYVQEALVRVRAHGIDCLPDTISDLQRRIDMIGEGAESLERYET